VEVDVEVEVDVDVDVEVGFRSLRMLCGTTTPPNARWLVCAGSVSR
jgi:hypothetical protein